MAAIILPHKWTRQPQTPVSIDGDYAHPSLSVFLPSIGINDVAGNGVPWSVSSTPIRTYGSRGVAQSEGSTTSGVYKPRQATTGAFTILCSFEITAAGPDDGIFALQSSANSGSPILIGQNTGTGTIQFYWGGSYRLAQANAGLAGSKRVVVLRWDGTNLTGFMDGAYLGSYTGTQSGTGAQIWFGNGYSNSADCQIYLGAYWHTDIGYLKAIALSSNPWQLFKPIERRLWVPSTASGGATLLPSLLTDGDIFHAATVSAGAVTITPALYSDGDTFHNATVAAGSVNLAPSLVTDGDTFHAASVSQGGATQELTPALFIDAPHTVTANPDGDIDATGFTPTSGTTLYEMLLDKDDVNYISGGNNSVEVSLTNMADPGISTGHRVSFRGWSTNGWSVVVLLQGATTIASKSNIGDFATSPTDYYFDLTPAEADAITDYNDLRIRLSGLIGTTYYSWVEFSVDSSAGDTFHAATVAAGAVTLLPSLVSDGDTFYTHALVLEGGPQTLSPDLVVDGDTFHAATVTPGAVTLTPSLYTDADTFHAAEVASGFNLHPPAYADPDTFYPATVAAGAVTLAPDLLADGDTFYPATVANAGVQTLEPSLLADDDTFYIPTVTGGARTIGAARSAGSQAQTGARSNIQTNRR